MKKGNGVIPARSLTHPRSHIVCLCGSTRFKDDFIRLNFELTMAGFIVLTVGFFGHSDATYEPTRIQKIALDRLHKEKIDLADYVLVVDKDDYIGDSTGSEIEYAMETAKPVLYASTRNSQGHHPWFPINPVINATEAPFTDIAQIGRPSRLSASKRGRIIEP